MIDKDSPIGIFDSGVGGLTVVKAVQEALPNENIIYFGDTARVPYGIKSEQTIRNYSLQIVDFLLQQEVKMILIACNSVSASAHQAIEEAAGSIPVLNVITSGAQAAISLPNHRHIGVIGTLATIGSGAYEKEIQQFDTSITVTSRACSLLVPLAEEGWVDDTIAHQVIERYLEHFDHSDIESLILGCTHYPLFKPLIQHILHDKAIQIVDSGDSIARAAQRQLKADKLLKESGEASFSCYVSDRPQRFQKLAERFLGREIEDVIITHV